MTDVDSELYDLIMGGFRDSAYRWEALPAYEVASDKGALGSDYDRYLVGAPEPDWDRKQPWLDNLRATHARGLRRQRVRLLHTPLHPYERYECEWGYALNGPAGEDIRVIDPTEHALPAVAVDHDFWLIDDHDPIRMYYAPDGTYLGATREPELLEQYRAARDAAWTVAEPFAPWWARHPEHHRSTRRIA